MMELPVIHQEFISQHPQIAGNVSLWVDKMLNEGEVAPAADMPKNMWYMPGSMLGQSHKWESDKGPQGVPEGVRPYMVVAVAPGFEDYASKDHLKSSVGRIMEEALESAGFDLGEVYYTTVTRFPRPIHATTYKACWIKPGWQYFLEEFRRVRPKAVLFLGSEMVKMAFGAKYTLEAVRGQILDFQGTRAMALTSHLSFVKNTAGLGAFVKQLSLFKRVADNPQQGALDGLSYPDRDYKVLNTIEDIRREVANEIRFAGARGVRKYHLAFDVETGTDTGHPEDDYVITFQWSHGPGHARVIPLYRESAEPLVDQYHTSGKLKGQPLMDDNGQVVLAGLYGGSGVCPKSVEDKVFHYDEAVEQIRKLFECDDFSWLGHAGREDFKWCWKVFNVPRNTIRDIIMSGRFNDTMLIYHLLENDQYGLKQLTLRFTDMGAYDAPMHNWVIENSGQGKLFPGDRENRFFYAYRDIAYKYLLPYAMCDVDATYRVFEALQGRLNAPDNAAIKDIYTNIEIPSQNGIMDVEINGMPADRDRLEFLSDLYNDRYEELIDELRTTLRWPSFNPNSDIDVRAFLYTGKYQKWEKAEARAKENKGCLRCDLAPIMSTGKYPTKWETVVDKGEEEYYAPSRASSTITTLLATYDVPREQRDAISILQKLSGIKNFINNFLQRPKETILSPVCVYGKGLLSCIDSRSRICTQISTLSETGRWRHRRPNLANLPKTKEKAAALAFEDYVIKQERAKKGPKEASVILDGFVEDEDFHVPKVRTGFMAEEGYVFMEADWKSAELFVMGYYSGDPEFIKMLESGMDPHGYNAVKVFKLDCHPNEAKDKHPDKRFAVKSLIFGLAYGLSVVGLSERLSVELKTLVSVEYAQEIVDEFFNTYPLLKVFFDNLKKDVELQGYVETMYGRRRYFPGVTRFGRDQLAAAKREAQNAPIQGTVADMLNVAMINLDRMRYETEVGERIQWELMVGIHDALLVHVKEEYKDVMGRVLRYCMRDCVPLPGTDGRRIDVDVEYGYRWGEFDRLELITN